MDRKQKSSGKIGTPPAERVANAATGAVLGAVVAGPVGALAGAAVGAMVEKGMPRRTRRKADTKETGNNAGAGVKRNHRRSSSKPDA